MPDRLTIARALREMATLLEIAGQEPFRARAYARGAEALERLDADLGHLVEERRLTDLSGIGPGLAAMIAELYHTGRSQALEEQRRRVPAIALELRRIPRLGLAKIAALQEARGVEDDRGPRGGLRGRPRARGEGPRREDRALDPRAHPPAARAGGATRAPACSAHCGRDHARPLERGGRRLRSRDRRGALPLDGIR